MTPKLIFKVAVFGLALCGNATSARPPLQYFARNGSTAPFSAAVRVGDILYLSGQIGIAPDGSVPPEMTKQAQFAMENLNRSLTLAGASMADVFKCLIMLTDMKRWDEFNGVYITYFKAGRLPARSAIGAAALARGAGVEIECLAYLPEGR